MVTFEMLRAARPAKLSAAGEAWVALSRRLGVLEGWVASDVTRPLTASGWSGAASEAGFRQFDKVDDELELAAQQARGVASLLEAAAGQLATLQRELDDEVRRAIAAGMRVTPQGTVIRAEPLSIELATSSYDELVRAKAEMAAFVQGELGKVVKRAEKWDATFSGALRRYEPLTPGNHTMDESQDAIQDAKQSLELLGLSTQTMPRPASNPAEAAAWWRGLTDTQRQAYISAYPERIGALDGLPATARDKANRLQLRSTIAYAEFANHPSAHLDRARNLLQKLEDSERGAPNQQLMLLGVNNFTEDGEAIVAVGNPDTARHTAVYVPGTSASLDGLTGDDLERAASLQRASDDLTPNASGDVATIVWLGSDAPSDLPQAPNVWYAEHAAPTLDRFVDGLRASHEGERAHLTAVGHSYGSVVVGEAARQGDGLAVDDIVAVGSPGMNVERASDLHLDTRHVWAAAAPDDPIVYLSSTPGGYNEEPSDDNFGANRIRTDTPGHSEYWKYGPDGRPTESLNNQARIVMGRYSEVTAQGPVTYAVPGPAGPLVSVQDNGLNRPADLPVG